MLLHQLAIWSAHSVYQIKGDYSQLIGWLLAVLLLGLQGVIFYAVFRYVALGKLRINPFRKGWNHLFARYGTSSGPAAMELTSVVMGAANYSNGMYIAFDETGVFMQESIFAKGFLHLPYHDFILVSPPGRVTILLYPIDTAGIFKIAGVELFLATAPSNRLIAHLERPA